MQLFILIFPYFSIIKRAESKIEKTLNADLALFNYTPSACFNCPLNRCAHEGI